MKLYVRILIIYQYHVFKVFVFKVSAPLAYHTINNDIPSVKHKMSKLLYENSSDFNCKVALKMWKVFETCIINIKIIISFHWKKASETDKFHFFCTAVVLSRQWAISARKVMNILSTDGFRLLFKIFPLGEYCRIRISKFCANRSIDSLVSHLYTFSE